MERVYGTVVASLALGLRVTKERRRSNGRVSNSRSTVGTAIVSGTCTATLVGRFRAVTALDIQMYLFRSRHEVVPLWVLRRLLDVYATGTTQEILDKETGYDNYIAG